MLDRTRLAAGMDSTSGHTAIAEALDTATDGRLEFVGVSEHGTMSVAYAAPDGSSAGDRAALTEGFGRLADGVRSASMERGLFVDPISRGHREATIHRTDRIGEWTLLAVGRPHRCLFVAVEGEADVDALLTVVHSHAW